MVFQQLLLLHLPCWCQGWQAKLRIALILLIQLFWQLPWVVNRLNLQRSTRAKCLQNGKSQYSTARNVVERHEIHDFTHWNDLLFHSFESPKVHNSQLNDTIAIPLDQVTIAMARSSHGMAMHLCQQKTQAFRWNQFDALPEDCRMGRWKFNQRICLNFIKFQFQALPSSPENWKAFDAMSAVLSGWSTWLACGDTKASFTCPCSCSAKATPHGVRKQHFNTAETRETHPLTRKLTELNAHILSFLLMSKSLETWKKKT